MNKEALRKQFTSAGLLWSRPLTPRERAGIQRDKERSELMQVADISLAEAEAVEASTGWYSWALREFYMQECRFPTEKERKGCDAIGIEHYLHLIKQDFVFKQTP